VTGGGIEVGNLPVSDMKRRSRSCRRRGRTT